MSVIYRLHPFCINFAKKQPISVAIFTKNLTNENPIHGWRNLIHEWKCHPWKLSMDGEMSSMDGEMSSMDGKVSSMDVIHGKRNVIHGWLFLPWMPSIDDIHGWRRQMTDMDAAYIIIVIFMNMQILWYVNGPTFSKFSDWLRGVVMNDTWLKINLRFNLLPKFLVTILPVLKLFFWKSAKVAKILDFCSF